jgi:lysylphosphatidylglycerol synthetase-like protein (DUF2156 family)
MNSAVTQTLAAKTPNNGSESVPLPALAPAAVEPDADASLQREARPARMAASPVPVDARIQLLRQHGGFGYAYTVAFQSDLERFGDERGMLAYKTVGGTALVLSDPIAPREHQADLIARFVEDKRDVCFWSVSRPTAEILAPMGFFINEMGPENRIDLDTYNFSGPAQAGLRRAINRTAKLGYVTRECSFAALDLQQVEAVSNAWRRKKTVRTREISFLNRPIVLEDEMDVRKFFTFDAAGKIVAFSFFDPVYRDGQVVGYCNHIKRWLPETDPLVATALTCHAITTFKREGKKWLFLAISPFADIKGIKDDSFKRSWWVWRCFRTAYRNPLFNRFVFPLRNLHEHKRRFHAVTEQTYYATNRRPSLLRILKLLRVCRIV